MTPVPERESPDAARRFLIGIEGASLPGAVAGLLSEGVAGVALFPRNFTTIAGLRRLTEEIRRAAGRPVLLGIDQEGGTKFSLPEPFTQWPCPAEMGRLGDAVLEERLARAVARELAAVGCNLVFAPMLDLHMNPQSPVTQLRSFGSNPAAVARLGAAFLRGLAFDGILGCAKHYPGHGDAAVDPHEDLPVFYGTMECLERVELVPFRAAVAAGVPLVMTAHILLPQIDPSNPASLSRRMLAGTLRGRMKFGGIILADDLGMGAIAKRFAPGEAAVHTLLSGSDAAMLCHDFSAVRPAIATVERAYHSGCFDAAEWEASRQRIDRVCALSPSVHQQPALDAVGCAEHRALAAELRQRIEALPRSS